MIICFSPHLSSLLFNRVFILALVFACTYFGHVHVFIQDVLLVHALLELWYVSVFCASPSRIVWVDRMFYWIVAFILFYPTHFLMTGISVPDFVYICRLF